MFVTEYPTTGLRPAAYNPRHIDQDALARLRESIERLGVLKPIIVAEGGLIIAGHQRTRTLLSMGVQACPAHVIAVPSVPDEIKFNMVHNTADMEVSLWSVRVPPQPGAAGTWPAIPPREVVIERRDGAAAKLADACDLLSRYGEWGNCVATESGEVVAGQIYAASCRQLNMPVRAVIVRDELGPAVRRHMGQEYGVFSYEHLEKQTWHQSFAQKFRLRESRVARTAGKRGTTTSTLYERMVLPRLFKKHRLIDFGAGQKDYATLLQGRGFQVWPVEFFHRKRERQEIDVAEIHADIDSLCRELSTNGLADIVVCDSVLNSVDSLQAEADVMTCIAALCRPGGLVIFSGRNIEGVLANESDTEAMTRHQSCFMDKHGFAGIFTKGGWLYQKYHRLSEARALAERYVGTIRDVRGEIAFWGIVAEKTLPTDHDAAVQALRREFNLPWPGGRSVGRADEIEAAYQAAVGRLAAA